MMGEMRILVADKPELAAAYREFLDGLGYRLLEYVSTGNQLVQRCRAQRPDLVIAEIDLPGLDGIAAASEINRQRTYQVPVILVAAHHDAATLDRVVTDHVMAYLTKPVKPTDLAAAIQLGVIRFQHYKAGIRRAADLAQALADRKLVERAKRVLMANAQVDEAEAFRCLEKLAADKNRKVVEIARDVLIAEEAFQASPGQSEPKP